MAAMILNAFAVLDGFLCLLRLGLGGAVLVLACVAWRQTGIRSSENIDRLQDRCYLAFLLAGLLLVLDILSWPIFYLLLESYVSEWPGIMCIYGVTRIGTGSVGSSRFLPPLVTALECAKPALIFLSGNWFVLYLLNRTSRTAPLTRRVLSVVLLTSILGSAVAVGELAYLVIPKKEDFPAAGCCTEAFDGEERLTRFVPRALLDESAVPWLWGGYYGVNTLMLLSLTCCRPRLPRNGALAALLLMACLVAAVSGVFLVEVAVPRLIRLPSHHCPYDLVPRAPESLLAIAFFVVGVFAVGWSCAVAWLGRHSETTDARSSLVGQLLDLAVAGYASSLLMISVELALT